MTTFFSASKSLRIILFAALFFSSLGLKGETHLTDYVGTYSEQPENPVEIIAGDELFAVLDGAKYRLHFSAPDEFLNAVGGKISFRRDAANRVIGYKIGRAHV